jgi:catechol 2,3-dioxygenase-like lactoylglutathione lyase family enzyme
MINGGNVTVMVSDMETAVSFYTETLGLKLTYRAGNEWAEIDAGPGVTIGLHRAGQHGPAPGTPGSLSIGFNIEGRMEEAMETLRSKGVIFRGPVIDNPNEGVRLAFFGDPDGTSLYLCELIHAGEAPGA